MTEEQRLRALVDQIRKVVDIPGISDERAVKMVCRAAWLAWHEEPEPDPLPAVDTPLVWS